VRAGDPGHEAGFAMSTLKLTLAYDGTAYVGWQRQGRGVSVQGLVEEALERIDGGAVSVVAAGRTDAGVHANGQVARAVVRSRLDVSTIQRALNATLPPDVRVLRVDPASDTFHPRVDARSKTYQYWWWNAPVSLPLVRGWCWHVTRPLDASAMDEAARALEGCHDMAAFQSTGTAITSTTRTVTRSRVWSLSCGPCSPLPLVSRLVPADGRFVVFEIVANGFLRHMVRAIAGTLVEVGDGRRQPGCVPHILASNDRAQAGPTAPAQGLVLVCVKYDREDDDGADAVSGSHGPRACGGNAQREGLAG
jgi:tRNA pseudouridine38-40 synthase